VTEVLYRWTRLSSTTWEDAWVERLRILGPGKTAFITWHGSNALKIEAYGDEHTAQDLIKRFGGRYTRLTKQIWTGDANRPRAPLPIRGKLKIFSDRNSWVRWRKTRRKPRGVFIPAGMAFGTGEHATTATCLCLLTDITSQLPSAFTALDLGTGAGILAISAKAFGASYVEAIDHDPVAVRIARQNAIANEFRGIKIIRGDLLKLPLCRPFDIVMANLFPAVLITAATRLARATKTAGWLIFSGVLRRQAPEVARAIEKAGFSKPRIVIRGKWCAGICRKSRLRRGPGDERQNL
jgi:ribosomal protein L11 methyltransferase